MWSKLKYSLLVLFSSLSASERGGLIEIEGEIQGSTYAYVRHALDAYSHDGVDYIFVKINTPGGELFPSIRIAKALLDLKVPVIGYIDDWALSAGALIAYSCDTLYANEHALMGAATPVNRDMEEASEKIVSAVRAEFASLAKAHGRDPLLAEAMVDKDVVIDGLIEKGKLLTLTADAMVNKGIAKEVISSKEAIPGVDFQNMGIYTSWKTKFLRLLTHPMVAALLSIGFMLGVYFELSTPGFGIPGAVAMVCLILNLLIQYSADLFNFIEVIILGLGILLLLIEIFIIPGFGLIGTLGILLSFTGVTLLIVPEIAFPEISWRLVLPEIKEKILWALSTMLLFFGVGGVFHRKILRYFYQNSSLILHHEACKESEVDDFVGLEGVACSPFRPSGKIELSGMIYDAITEGSFIAKDARLKVKRKQGNTLVVTEV